MEQVKRIFVNIAQHRSFSTTTTNTTHSASLIAKEKHVEDAIQIYRGIRE
jgi:hypothetical protein